MSLPAFGVRNPVPMNLLMTATLLAGAFTAVSLRRQFFPEIDPESASVSLPYPGATPQEIEDTMAIKVEDKLADLDEVDTLRTTISEGGGGIVVEFREGIDVDEATDEVERKIDALQDLPDQAEEIQVTQFESRLPVIMVSVFGSVDEEVLKRSIREIRDDLKTLPDMGEAVISGVRDYELRVDVRADALLQHSISLPQIAGAIERWMADVPGGSIRSEMGNINVRTVGVTERAEAIREIVVKADGGGQSLTVGDIANVQESFVDEQLITRFNGKPAATLTVFKVGGQDIVEMAEMTRAYVAARAGRDVPLNLLERLLTALPAPMQEALPSTKGQKAWRLGLAASPLPTGTSVECHSDLARFVEGRLQLLIENAIYGAILVFATLLVFLNWRVAFWVGIGLVTALAGTLVLMKMTDVTLNLLTMFGLIVVLGILVDDAIVVAENVQAWHDRGEPSLVAAIRGAEEVFWPVVATVLTTVVAFLPLTFIKGQIGDLLGALPMVVTCALIMSLIESLLILPSHMGHSLVRRDRQRPGPLAEKALRFERWRDGIILNRIVPSYAKLLRRALHHRYLSISAAIAVVLVSVGLFAGGRVGFVFLPSDDAETLVVNINMPLGTSIQRTSEVVALLEEAVTTQDESKSVSAVVGQTSNLDTGMVDAYASHLGQVFIELKPVEERNRASSEVVDSLRLEMGTVEDLERITYQEVTGGPGGADITIELRGADIGELEQAVADVKRQLRTFDSVYDIFDDNAVGQRELQIELKPGAAALGFNVADVAAQVRGALFGLDAHVFSDQQEDIDVRVRLDEQTRRDLSAVESLWLIGPGGDRVPLMEIATLIDGSSYSTIKRVDRQRAITVTAAVVPGVSPESITAVFGREVLPGLRERHPRVDIGFAGRQEQMADAFASLPLGFLAAMAMIYVILAWLFGSYTLPLAVMLAIPFGIVGITFGHMILGYRLTFLSLIGAVALSGIVVNDSLIFMNFYIARRAEGVGVIEALIESGRRRLRPIFLTTITTVLGLTPLMLEQSFQARFLIPMAISIAFGLMSATVLILLVLPCIVVIVDDIQSAAFYLWNGKSRRSGERLEETVLDVMGE